MSDKILNEGIKDTITNTENTCIEIKKDIIPGKIFSTTTATAHIVGVVAFGAVIFATTFPEQAETITQVIISSVYNEVCNRLAKEGVDQGIKFIKRVIFNNV